MMAVDIIRASVQSQKVPHTGYPQIMPVTSARPVKNTPTSAELAAIRSHNGDFLISQTTPPIRVTAKARKASQAEGTCTNMILAKSP